MHRPSSSTPSLPRILSKKPFKFGDKYRLYLALYYPDPCYLPPPPGLKYDTVLLLVPKYPEVGVPETIRLEITEAHDDTSDTNNDTDVDYSELERVPAPKDSVKANKGKGKAKQHDWELAVSLVANREALLVSAAFLGKVNCRDPMERSIDVLKQVDLGRCAFDWVKCQWYWLAIEAFRDCDLIPPLRTSTARQLWEQLYKLTASRRMIPKPAAPLLCLDNGGQLMLSCEIGQYLCHHAGHGRYNRGNSNETCVPVINLPAQFDEGGPSGSGSNDPGWLNDLSDKVAQQSLCG